MPLGSFWNYEAAFKGDFRLCIKYVGNWFKDKIRIVRWSIASTEGDLESELNRDFANY